jgi:sugar lactone lactonase YvrE
VPAAQPEVFQRVPAKLGEGPCWDVRRQQLWWIDILGRKLFASAADGGAVTTIDLPEMPGCVVVGSTGELVVAMHGGVQRLSPAKAKFAPFSIPAGHDATIFRFNDGKVDPAGRLWAGTLALDSRPKQSCLYRFDGIGRAQVMRTGVSISNGLAWSPDGAMLYYIDSPTRQVQAFAFEVGAGTLGESRVAIALADDEGWPDGCCMDAEGCLWIGHWGAGRITRWDPVRGRRLATYRLPVTNVTSCAFGGARLDRLFITTAVDDGAKTPEPAAGFTFVLEPGVTGLAPHELQLLN